MNKVDLNQWRALYDLAGRVWALAPWEFMGETDLFGVEPEADGEIGFVSVMGALGRHKAVAVYQGSKGCNSWCASGRRRRDWS